MDSLKIGRRSLLNNRGVNTLLLLFVMTTVIFTAQGYMMMDHLNVFKNLKYTQNLEVRNSLISDLENILIEELALRNSRFNVNTNLYRCLYAVPSPCSELETYDLVLFSPNPPVLHSGGAWPAPPAGIARIAGGLTADPVFYTSAAGICPGATAPNNACPLQAIVQFRPLCGGTISAPNPMAVPGVCPGRATGFDVIIGVGIYNGNMLKYSGIPNASGDARIYRIKANSLIN
jgi:hypothetical protein